MSDPTLLWATAAEVGRRVQRREVSSVEVTTACLEALGTRGRALNAVAELTADLALAQAARADREIAAGHIRGPLHGVPYGAKDLLATRGIPTRWGSPAHRDQVFDYDATAIERLRDAGAVLVAKLAMVELAGAGGYAYAAASLTGPGRNPWDPGRWTGGSSSGSGAAVGGGLVPFALGSETWGSIVLPSAFCNVCGLRPTYGRVPRFGAMALSWTLDKIGPMARSAEDCALVLAAIAGPDPRDASSTAGPFSFDHIVAAGRPLRLGVLAHDYTAADASEAQARFMAALEVFRAQGHAIGEATLPDYPYDAAARTIVQVEGAAAFENLIRGPRLGELANLEQQAGLIASLDVPGVDYLRALRIRTLAGPVAIGVFARFDALVAPTVLRVATPLEQRLDEALQGMGGNGGPGNLLGWPSISIPMGPGRDGLPLGLELIGPPDSEATLLALAMQFQRDTSWHNRRTWEETLLMQPEVEVGE